MPAKTKIEWTDTTWNPVTGCTKVSSGCKYCYAERMAIRLRAMGQERYKNGFEVTLHHDLIEEPFKWIKPRIIFVNSMSDLFHEDIPFEFIQQIFHTMAQCPQHIFQILTKRSERLRRLAHQLNWPENVWIGVSIENESTIHRLDDLKHVPAFIRFLSCEPLLGPLKNLALEGIHWVIVGGESGPGARPMRAEWVDSILWQCKQQNVEFFFKQWGGVQKKRTGRILHGKTYSALPRLAYKHRSANLLFKRA
ncbi:Gp37Gp68 family protein [Candidatus Vecturithrix granuli]|uniref:Gp37Gp68 family protein n=1 Tax=Vecturithrix granuli TaxID=1499967 RepID=A0A081C8A7_VECG1|nr:Gp37Gp68 family protein [Candidatus Vecturithrix granuli]